MSKRVRVRCPVTLDVGGNVAKALCVDLSATGCAIETAGELEVGAPVNVSIELPVQGTVRAKAEVVRTQPGMVLRGLGLRLVALDQSSLSRLHTYLAQAT